ncbi:MAG: peptidase S41 [Bacteroidetes bacterium]|nr:MAG: peptidase S41 [Bacteroidota bacterium]
MRRERVPAYLPLFLSLAVILGILIGFALRSGGERGEMPLFTLSEEGMSKHKVLEVLNYIEQDYVDTVDMEKMEEVAIVRMLEELDPHSVYIPKEDFEDVNESLQGNFEGIGVQFRMEEDTITVVKTLPKGPSEKVGILAGDRIVTVDDSLVAGKGLQNSDVVKLLKGPKGTKVMVGVYRRGFESLLPFSITRDVIPTESVDIAYKPNDSVGYIKVNTFAVNTGREFSRALASLMDPPLSYLILDLRGNTGGYLQSAIAMADEFLVDGKMIVYTEGLNRPKRYAHATRNGLYEKGELVILVDEGSASASEIVAGAIQDNDRGTIVGRRSFGKGLVQEQHPLNDGAAVRITVSRYYTPTGRSIQKPYGEDNEAYYMEYYERFTNGELESIDSVHFADSLKYYTPAGKVVYGGGGIMPDVFVPLERIDHNRFYYEMINKGVIYAWAFHYTDTHRADLERFENSRCFIEDFQVSPAMLSQFYTFCQEKGVKEAVDVDKETEARIRLLMKAYVGRNLFDDEGFYPLYHQMDQEFQRALSLF